MCGLQLKVLQIWIFFCSPHNSAMGIILPWISSGPYEILTPLNVTKVMCWLSTVCLDTGNWSVPAPTCVMCYVCLYVLCMCVSTYTCVCACMCACVYMYVHVRVYKCSGVCVYMYVCVYIVCVCTAYVCTCVYMYLRVCSYLCIMFMPVHACCIMYIDMCVSCAMCMDHVCSVYAFLGTICTSYVLHCGYYTTLATCVGGEIENGVICSRSKLWIVLYPCSYKTLYEMQRCCLLWLAWCFGQPPLCCYLEISYDVLFHQSLLPERDDCSQCAMCTPYKVLKKDLSSSFG